MPIFPYKQTPVPPTVALLESDGSVTDEHGDTTGSLAELGAGARVWASWETVLELLEAGAGEALHWNGGPIRYRHGPGSDPPSRWTPRATDAHVLRLPFPELTETAVRGLAHWRDWLARYGATPRSLGSAGFSLVRATLTGPLWTRTGTVPPIRFPLGGRQLLAAEAGTYRHVRHHDLEAAYPRALGRLVYGGRWTFLGPEAEHAYRRLATGNPPMPVYVRARVAVPELPFGPLPRRPRRRPHPVEELLFPVEYPTAATVQGVWTWQELHEAEQAGCTIKRTFGAWVHFPDGTFAGLEHRPFRPWLAAIEDGRQMSGFAGRLAKATGSATWGSFAISGDGVRDVRTFARRRGKLRLTVRRLEGRPTRPAAPDLAELVCAGVRVQFNRFVRLAGDRLLAGHTDGGWVRDDGWPGPTGEWRTKPTGYGRRLDLLTPQTLRYWTRSGHGPYYAVSGVPPERAAEAFAEAWRLAGFEEPARKAAGADRSHADTPQPDAEALTLL